MKREKLVYLVLRDDAGQEEDHGGGDVADLVPERVVGVVRLLTERQERGPCRLHTVHHCAEHAAHMQHVLGHPERHERAENDRT